jgi:poly(ADP-ribose) glycohydrolase ARH3
VIHRLQAKFIGCLVGSALGDAIGELAFRFPDQNHLVTAIERADLLRYTDDTAMAVGLAQSLVERGALDSEHLGRIFHLNFLKEPWRGYAPGPPAIFAMVESSGISYTDAARTLFGGRGSFGNGAAMRVAPLGLFFHDSPDLYDLAGTSAGVTHAHPLARDGAAVQARAVSQAVQLNPQEYFSADPFMGGLLDFSKTTELQEKLHSLKSLLDRRTPCGKSAEALGKTVAIHESLPFAIYAFLKHPHSFEECLFCAVLSGGDRDTLGAMAGAICGAHLGIDAIPRKWQNHLENRDLLERLALALLQRSTATKQ